MAGARGRASSPLSQNESHTHGVRAMASRPSRAGTRLTASPSNVHTSRSYATSSA